MMESIDLLYPRKKKKKNKQEQKKNRKKQGWDGGKGVSIMKWSRGLNGRHEVLYVRLGDLGRQGKLSIK